MGVDWNGWKEQQKSFHKQQVTSKTKLQIFISISVQHMVSVEIILSIYKLNVQFKHELVII